MLNIEKNTFDYDLNLTLSKLNIINNPVIQLFLQVRHYPVMNDENISTRFTTFTLLSWCYRTHQHHIFTWRMISHSFHLLQNLHPFLSHFQRHILLDKQLSPSLILILKYVALPKILITMRSNTLILRQSSPKFLKFQLITSITVSHCYFVTIIITDREFIQKSRLPFKIQTNMTNLILQSNISTIIT